MTIVDDSLAGGAPVRGGKGGGKHAKQAETAAQKDAFNRAFSEAGKKQQPQISLRDKAAPDASSNRISIQNAAKIDTPRAAETGRASAKPADDARTPFKNDLEILQEALPENTQTALPDDDAPKPVADEPVQNAKSKPETVPVREKNPLDRLSAVLEKLSHLPSDKDRPIANADIADRLADVFKDRKAELSDAPRIKDRTPSLTERNEAAASDAASPADVDQLLALLQAAQGPQVPQDAQIAQASVPVQPAKPAEKPHAADASGLSEFQALADRAVRPGLQTAGAAPAAKGSEATHADAALPHKAEAGEIDQIFRFARADGKGQPVSMKVSNDGDRTKVDTDTATPAAKAETVTVVEARRYLGVAAVSSNAQAVTSAITGSGEWARSIQQTAAADTSFQQTTGKVVNTLKIQMHPIDLGMVTATLRLKDDELHVDLKVETGDAFRQLSDDQGAIVKALRAQGFAVDQVNIVFNSGDTGNSGQPQQQQSFAPNGQNGGREAQPGGGNGAQQGREQRQDGGNQQGERWTANDTTGDASSSDPGRPGYVYM